MQEVLSAQLQELDERAKGQAVSVAEKEDLMTELSAMKAQLEAQQQASSAKIDELTIAREKQLMELAAKADGERLELFQSAAVRRLHNRDLSGAFNAWLTFHDSKVFWQIGSTFARVSSPSRLPFGRRIPPRLAERGQCSLSNVACRRCLG